MLLFSLLLVLGAHSSVTFAADKYYGVPIGPLRNYAHGIAGDVYVVSEDTIFIKGFSYDGQGPDAFFWIGFKTDAPSPDGILLNYPADASSEASVLQSYNNADIVLRLPAGLKVREMKWLSIWCRRFTVNFGDVTIPRDLKPPQTRKLEEFSRLAHKVRSGNIEILNTKTFYIPNFHYDGQGPDAYFWVGNGSEPSPAGTKVPDERGSEEILRGYMGQDIEITLPGDMTMYDIQWLSVWCVEYRHNFGWVKIPNDLSNLPPYLEQSRQTVSKLWSFFTEDQVSAPVATGGVSSQLSNCRPFVNDKMHVRWGADSLHAYIELSAQIEENEWLGFGISGNQSRAQMEGGDVIVAFYDAEDATYRAEDYLLTLKAQCTRQGGVCPDESIGGSNDAQVISGQRKNGVTTIAFKRPLNSGDTRSDQAIPSYGDVQVIAAIGTLNTRKQANYHSQGWGTAVIDFSAVNMNQCAGLGGTPVVEVVNAQPWPERTISDVTRFRARIGPTGGRRGYQSVTGFPSWGIAWWINDLLIPKIYVRRGETYTFTVEGGDDPSNPAEYHPMYITNDPEGGYGSKNQTGRSKERVFAGVRPAAIGGPVPTAAGRLCEYVLKSSDQKDTVSTFEEYRATLELECAPGNPATLEWLVKEDTPDTVYYQCYTHRNLGWKIHVLEAGGSGTAEAGKGGSATYGAAATLLVSTLAALLMSS